MSSYKQLKENTFWSHYFAFLIVDKQLYFDDFAIACLSPVAVEYNTVMKFVNFPEFKSELIKNWLIQLSYQ